MKQIILQKACQMVAQIEEKIIEKELDIEKCMPELVRITQSTALDIYRELIEQTDATMKAGKQKRRQEGLVVERNRDPRTLITSIGDLQYERTYYWNRKKNQYEYPVDRLLGIEHYERVDPGLSKGLVSCARTRSYRDSSRKTCRGSVTAQTVMNKKHFLTLALVPVKVFSVHIEASDCLESPAFTQLIALDILFQRLPCMRLPDSRG